MRNKATGYVRDLFFINFTYKTKESQCSCTNLFFFSFFSYVIIEKAIFCTSRTQVHDWSTPRFHREFNEALKLKTFID